MILQAGEHLPIGVQADPAQAITIMPNAVWVAGKEFRTIYEAYDYWALDDMRGLYDLREEAHGRTKA